MAEIPMMSKLVRAAEERARYSNMGMVHGMGFDCDRIANWLDIVHAILAVLRAPDAALDEAMARADAARHCVFEGPRCWYDGCKYRSREACVEDSWRHLVDDSRAARLAMIDAVKKST